MLEEACEDLFGRALPVAEPEAVVPRDRVQLAIGQLGNSAEGLARGCELLVHDGEIDVFRRVLVLVLAGSRSVFGGLRGSVAEGAKESRHAMAAARGRFVRDRHPVGGLDERRDPAVVVSRVPRARSDGAVAELL